MPLCVLKQHRTISRGCIDVSGEKGDRACPLTQHTAERQGMIDGTPFLDIALDNLQRLIGESLQPEEASLEIMGRYPHIETQSDDLGLLRQSREARQHPLDVMPGSSLVSQIVQRGRENAITHDKIDGIARIPHQIGEPLGIPERRAELAAVELIDA